MKDSSFINPKVISAFNEVENMKFHLQKKTGSPYYFVNFFLKGKRKSLSTKETKKKLATQKARHMIQDLIFRSEQTPLEIRAVNDVIDLYSKNISKNRRRYLEWWKSHLGDRSIQDITQDLLDDLCNLYSQEHLTNKPQSNNTACSGIFAFLSWCKDRKYTKTTYKQNKEKVTDIKQRRLITDDEFKSLLCVCNEDDYSYLKDPLLFYMNTAFRKGELVNLKREDVVRETQSLILRNQKNGTINQPIKLNSLAWQIVLRNLIKHNQEYLFQGKGKNGSLGDFKKAWITIRKKAGVTDIDIHCIRHTAIMKVAMSKECTSVHQLKQFSRHNSDNGLTPYLHALQGDQLLQTVELATWGKELL